ncbi:MazG-like family protein [Candidatus Woesearchaeota archaeon]|nr:MazG-like family protein [Candidatus Woesearchaeota archaeon]MCF7901041.1 MazG-like family protein [Candidatus Woesearchaeota archaeon]MCF8013378.1 MazG-like family protein [Candidatus Woesearchaeota archaeon]
MEINEMQDYIKKFNDERNWSNPGSIKDLMLNMNEEIGEFWNVIKWVDTETQMKLINENKAEIENYIGDMLYLIFKVAYLCKIESDKAIKDVMKEYEQRFPIEKTKGNHANKLAGGIDLKKDANN